MRTFPKFRADGFGFPSWLGGLLVAVLFVAGVLAVVELAQAAR